MINSCKRPISLSSSKCRLIKTCNRSVTNICLKKPTNLCFFDQHLTILIYFKLSIHETSLAFVETKSSAMYH